MIWQGRNDGDDPLNHRIFQKVSLETDYDTIETGDFVLHGFAVDEGVRRNKGREGAKDAPDIIRKSMANFPIVKPQFSLKDFGNVECQSSDLEGAQINLAEKVSQVIRRGGKSIVLGGGHEVMFAHYSGIKKAFPDQKIGIINIDAHFDNRMIELEVGPTSGTGFWQITQEGNLNSLHIGIQRNSNTLKLFDTAHQNGMKYILAEELFFENLPKLYEEIDIFTKSVDLLYVTICMDVFNAAIAPGVSSPSYNGLFADAAFMHLYKHILVYDQLVALDIAEINPKYDHGEKTARLAGAMLNEWMTL